VDSHPHRTTRVNWRQAGGEALILLAGVLLALVGQAWWESRSEGEIVRGHVANLMVELASNRTGLHAIVEQHTRGVEHGTALIRVMGEAGSPQAADSILLLISELTTFSDFRPASAALDNLVGAGGLGLIENSDVQLAVSRYSQAISDHNVLQSELASYQINEFMGFLRGSVPLLLTDYSASVRESVSSPRFDFDPGPLVGSMEFENVVLGRIRSESDASNYARRLLEALESLAELLEG